jgi:hypothetical protein
VVGGKEQSVPSAKKPGAVGGKNWIRQARFLELDTQLDVERFNDPAPKARGTNKSMRTTAPGGESL